MKAASSLLASILIVLCLGDCCLAAEIVAVGDDPCERYAADELRHWIGELSEAPCAEKFRLGVDVATAFPEDRAWIGETDGFAVRRRGDEVCIFANRPAGVLYGVYAFLERNSDLVFVRPDPEAGVVFTRTKKFEARDADFRERPVFLVRGWTLCGSSNADAARWCARLRCNCLAIPLGAAVRTEKARRNNLELARRLGFKINPGGGHNLYLFMPDECFDEHPEYFCERGGRRIRRVRDAQLCFSSMEGACVVGQEAVRRIAEFGFEPESYQIKTQDNLNWCECAKCRAPIVLPDGRRVEPTDANFRSTQFFIWLNAVMKEIRKVYTHVQIQTFVYQNTVDVPSVLPCEGIEGLFCPYVKNDKFPLSHPANADKWKSRIDAWAQVGFTNLCWREYWGCARGFPRPLSDVMVQDLRYLADVLHIARVCSETQPDKDLSWDVSAMEHWVLSRLMWDPHQEPSDLRTDYLKRAYRSAARPTGEFFEAIRKAWYASDRRSLWSDGPPTMAYHYIHETGLTDACREALVRAEAAAKDDLPQVQTNVKRLRARFEFWMAHVRDFSTPEVVVPRTDDWAKASVITEFRRRGDPGRWPWPRETTKVELRHDGKALFVRATCGDMHMKTISAAPFGEADDRKFKGDQFQLMLIDGDPESKDVRIWSFAVDANGNRNDARVKPSNWRWDSDAWTAKATRNAKDFTVEMSIPFSTIGFNPRKKKELGVIPTRVYRHNQTDGSTAYFTWLGVDARKPVRRGILHFQ